MNDYLVKLLGFVILFILIATLLFRWIRVDEDKIIPRSKTFWSKDGNNN